LRKISLPYSASDDRNKNKERYNTMKTLSKITLAAAALALLGIAAASTAQRRRQTLRGALENNRDRCRQ